MSTTELTEERRTRLGGQGSGMRTGAPLNSWVFVDAHASCSISTIVWAAGNVATRRKSVKTKATSEKSVGDT